MLQSTQPDNLTRVSVDKATEIILSHRVDYGNESIRFEQSTGRVLANDIFSDIDFPPFDRITMDGIGIRYRAFENGAREFEIKGVQAAGDSFVNISFDHECIEVMTGASLSPSIDTIIRYEDVIIENGFARITTDNIRKGQNVHRKGEDKKSGEIIAQGRQVINPALIAALASSGKTKVDVRKLPTVMVISTGNEIIDPDQTPGPFEIRNSNAYVISSALSQFGINASMMHLRDEKNLILENLRDALNNFDVIILCGGVSKGKFDFIPEALEQCGVKKLFHHVKQRPGKPFWFGTFGEKPVFSFPGNPVSVFLCLYRYFLPWLRTSLGLSTATISAVLNKEVRFIPQLQYFLPVKLQISEEVINAFPVITNGSGDFINLLSADAFLEFPSAKEKFNAGEIFPAWPFKNILNV